MGRRGALKKAVTVFGVAIASLLPTVIAHSAPLEEFYRSPRAMAMGNAYTAVADDLDSVFYNPAGLALLTGSSFVLFNPKIDVSGDVVRPDVDVGTNTYGVTTDLINVFQNFDSSKIQSLFGKHVYGSVSVFPAVQYKNFVMGYYYGGEAHLVVRNTAMPFADARYIRDSGYVAGWGMETRGFGRGHFARMGISGKWLTRQGLDKTIPISELVVADKNYIKNFSSGQQPGIGVNVGVQYDFPLTRFDTLTFGSAWTDVGDTNFGSALQATPPPPIRNNLSGGLAYVRHFGMRGHSFGNFKLSGEMRHLLQRDRDPRLKAHFGTELQLGDLALQAGISEMSITAGMSLDMWLLKISALTYAVENQSLAFMDRERRYMLQVTLKFDLFGKDGTSFREREKRRRPRDF